MNHTHTQVYTFGNPELTFDSLPLRLLPDLRAEFPHINFITLDPNEDWDIPRHMVIIDTVVNISEPTVFTDLSAFVAAPRVSCHDYDAYANLQLMKKVGELRTVTILGIPPDIPEDIAASWLITNLAELTEKEF